MGANHIHATPPVLPVFRGRRWGWVGFCRGLGSLGLALRPPQEQPVPVRAREARNPSSWRSFAYLESLRWDPGTAHPPSRDPQPEAGAPCHKQAPQNPRSRPLDHCYAQVCKRTPRYRALFAAVGRICGSPSRQEPVPHLPGARAKRALEPRHTLNMSVSHIQKGPRVLERYVLYCHTTFLISY